MENEGTTAATPKLSEGIAGWLESVIITTSQSTVGQALFKLIDSFLWVVEKSAQWSLPSHEIASDAKLNDDGKMFGKIGLVRPLPWILFLPGLVILRIVRNTLNVGAYILGYPQIQHSGMVKFVQRSRRRLRAFNSRAVKVSRRRTCTKDKRLTMIEAKKALIRSIRLTLSTLSCLDTSKSSPSPPPMKIRVSRMGLETITAPDEKSTTESAGSPVQGDKKRKFSEVSSDVESTDESEDGTLQSKLERFSMMDSSEDPDFNPTECSTESSTDVSSENEVDKEVSLSELADVKKEAESFFKGDDGPLITFLENLKSNSQKSEDTVDSLKRMDSSGESVYSSAKEFDEDYDTTFYSDVSWHSGSPEQSLCCEPVVPKLCSRRLPNLPSISLTEKLTPRYCQQNNRRYRKTVSSGSTPRSTSTSTPMTTPTETPTVAPPITPMVTPTLTTVPEVTNGVVRGSQGRKESITPTSQTQSSFISKENSSQSHEKKGKLKKGRRKDFK